MGIKNRIVTAARYLLHGGAPSKEYKYVLNIQDVGRLQHCNVIVTGATGAIGSAICYRLVAEGATVGIAGRNQDKIDKVLSQIQGQDLGKNAGNAIPLILDVNNDEMVRDVIRDFDKTYGLNAFVNNAGIGFTQGRKILTEQDMKTVDSVLNTNLRASVVCAQTAAQCMIAHPTGGHIINMASVVGMRGKSRFTDYATSKAGILGFTQSLAIELGKYHITVNSISPGMITIRNFDSGDGLIPNNNCLKRMGHPDEVAGLVAYILTDSYITGHNFVIDGGRSLGLMGDME